MFILCGVMAVFSSKEVDMEIEAYLVQSPVGSCDRERSCILAPVPR
jgi:hypothetical protein